MMISNIGKILFASFVILGIVGWIILVIPDLHFLYKDYLGLLGQLKLLALVLAALGMFFAMPVWLADRLYQRLRSRAWPLFDYGHCLPCGYLDG